MRITDKTRKIVVFVGAVLLIAGIILYLTIGKEDKITLTGEWYAYDSEGLNTLTLNTDGTYTNEGGIMESSGRYTITEETIEMTDRYGYKSVGLRIGEDTDGSTVLSRNNFIYFRTIEKAQEGKKAREDEEKHNAALFMSSAHQILQKAVWTETAGSFTYSISFSEKEFVMSSGNKKTTCQYEILSVEMEPGVLEDKYIITWNVTRDGHLDRNVKAVILYKPAETGDDDDEYELISTCFSNYYAYTYKGNINMEMPDSD